MRQIEIAATRLSNIKAMRHENQNIDKYWLTIFLIGPCRTKIETLLFSPTVFAELR